MFHERANMANPVFSLAIRAGKIRTYRYILKIAPIPHPRLIPKYNPFGLICGNCPHIQNNYSLSELYQTNGTCLM